MRLQAFVEETFVLFGVRNHDKATSLFVPHLRRYFVVTSPRNGVGADENQGVGGGGGGHSRRHNYFILRTRRSGRANN